MLDTSAPKLSPLALMQLIASRAGQPFQHPSQANQSWLLPFQGGLVNGDGRSFGPLPSTLPHGRGRQHPNPQPRNFGRDFGGSFPITPIGGGGRSFGPLPPSPIGPGGPGGVGGIIPGLVPTPVPIGGGSFGRAFPSVIG